MKHPHDDRHPSAEQLQALLDGALPDGERDRVTGHVDGCPRCAAEFEAWSTLFADLGGLPELRPGADFSERVVASIPTLGRAPLTSRLAGRLFSGHVREHVDTAALHDFLDGTLAARSAERVERHLRACRSCAEEVDAWIAIARRLEGLESFEPSEGFADRVIESIELPSRLPLAARIRAFAARLRRAPTPKHVPVGLLQDFVDGSLPVGALARVRSHVEACASCTQEAAAWRGVVSRLDALERLAPSAGFADAVMGRVRASEAAVLAPRRAPVWSRGLAAATRLVPQSREAWAALSGVAVTPAVVVGLVLYTLFSHPTLTVGALASFAWWQMTDLTSAALGALSAAAVQSSEVFGLYSIVEFLASAPALVAGAALAYTALSLVALRVLYKNLYATRSSRSRRNHAPATS